RSRTSRGPHPRRRRPGRACRKRASPPTAPSAASAVAAETSSDRRSGRTSLRADSPRPGRLRPAAGPRLLGLDRVPVVAHRREDLDDQRSFGTDDDRVRHVREAPPRRSGPELTCLTADRERDRALEEDAHLLVGVRVLGDDGAGIELEQAQGHPLAMDRATDDPVPDLLRPERGDVGEDAHRTFTLPMKRRPRNQAEWPPCPASPFWLLLPWS